jgi:hypothetical protein
MQEKTRKILLICLEVVSMAIFLPVFYWGAVRFMLKPIGKTFYPPDLYHEHRVVSTWMVFVFILVFNAIWFILLELCPREKIHTKVVLTLLVLTFLASVLSCFVVLDALEGAFIYDVQINQVFYRP